MTDTKPHENTSLKSKVTIKESNNDYSHIDIKRRVNGYFPRENIISLTLKRGSKISDNDIENYFCDVLIHESLHKTLYDLFPNEDHHIKSTISSYLDIIQHHLRSEEYLKIIESLYNTPNTFPWDKYISRFGIKRFFSQYGIKPDDVKYANDLLTFRNDNR